MFHAEKSSTVKRAHALYTLHLFSLFPPTDPPLSIENHRSLIDPSSHHLIFHHRDHRVITIVTQEQATLVTSTSSDPSKIMPLVHVTWLPKACRANPEVRKQVAAAIINAITNNEVAKAAEIPTHNVVVRFSEAVIRTSLGLSDDETKE
ncbi:hypothetical protein HJC23_008110 [Cyclotella cryptica]|uniref:Uncharacterized protein n=1 Tax=Cyclotella cryptica TaxID=29204 RepID=A0ABD3PCP3_9STRA